jgi:hypothetical protein
MTEANEEQVALVEALGECAGGGFESEGDYRAGGYVPEFDENKALELIVQHDEQVRKQTRHARDDEWQLAYHGTPGFGPKSPAELRVFVEEANQVNAEVVAHWKKLVLDFAKRLDGIYEKNAAREQPGKQDYHQIHLGGRQTEIATIAAELRALANLGGG